MATLLPCEVLNQQSSFFTWDRFSVSYTHESFYEKRQVIKDIASFSPPITFRAILLTAQRHVYKITG